VLDGRDTPIPGVGGKLVLDQVPSPTRRGWAPTQEAATSIALAWARPGDVVLTCDYGRPFAAAIERGRIFGVQFDDVDETGFVTKTGNAAF